MQWAFTTSHQPWWLRLVFAAWGSLIATSPALQVYLRQCQLNIECARPWRQPVRYVTNFMGHSGLYQAVVRNLVTKQRLAIRHSSMLTSKTGGNYWCLCWRNFLVKKLQLLMNQWVCLSECPFYYDLMITILGSMALLNRTIAAKLQAMLSTPWMPPLSCSHPLPAGKRSQWATQVWSVVHMWGYNALVVHGHTLLYVRIHTHAHMYAYSKAKLTAATTQLLLFSEWTLGCLALYTQKLKPCASNPPGAGLVTCRRTVQVSWIEVEKPKSSTTTSLLNETRTVEIVPPQFTLGTHCYYNWPWAELQAKVPVVSDTTLVLLFPWAYNFTYIALVYTYSHTHSHLLISWPGIFFTLAPWDMPGHEVLSNQSEALNFDQVDHVMGGRPRTIVGTQASLFPCYLACYAWNIYPSATLHT